MMFGGGHIADMIARLKDNRSLLKKKSFFEEMENRDFPEYEKHIEIKKLSKEERKVIRDSALKNRRRNDRRKLIVLSVSVIVLLGIILTLRYLGNLLEHVS